MMLRTLILAVAAVAMSSSANAEANDELTVIVNRSEDAATYYISMPASGIEPLLATDPVLLFSENGRVPIEDFRLAGSFDLADDIFVNITGSLEGNPIEFEAMSMMVHPTATPLPFAAPWDAYTAISVCSVDYAQDQLVPGKLQMYYGGFTDQVEGEAPLKLHFPQTGRDDLEIVVRSYEDGRLIGTDVQTLSDGGTLVIEAAGAIVLPQWMNQVLIGLALVSAAGTGIAMLRARFRKKPSEALTAQS